MQKNFPRFKIKKTSYIIMKLTKQKLYQLIEQVMLTEAAKGIDDIPEDYYVLCMKVGKGFRISLNPINDGDEELGYIYFDPVKPKLGNCLKGMVITVARADHGWGPFLYDLVMEKASIEASGIIPDRAIVSGPARAVWRYYLDNRMDDIFVRQLDNLEDSFKDGKQNDCSQKSSVRHLKSHWTQSPLSKLYSKDPTTIEKLKKLGKWTEPI